MPLEKAINKTWKNKKKPFKYAKNATDTYDNLQKYGDQKKAIDNAEKLSAQHDNEKFSTHNPRTQVYELVRQLIGQDENLNEEIGKEFK